MKKSDYNEDNLPEIDELTVTDEKNDTDVEFEEVHDEGEVDAKATIKKLRDKLRKVEEEKKEYLDLSQRTKADYLNFKKEVEQNRILERKFATKNLIAELLPVLDAYDSAQSNKASWEAVDQNWRMGIEYIFSQLKGVLEKEGVIQFGSVGEDFDPTLHESMEHVDVGQESEDGTIVQVLQKGYRVGDAILRPARVKTGSYKK